MPQPPGVLAMPTTLLNAALGLLPDRSLAVRSPDRLAAVIPMFDEEAGAGRALGSLLGQRVPVDQVVVSINGGSDRTPEVVAGALLHAGYTLSWWTRWGPRRIARTDWMRRAGGPVVTVLHHPAPVSKADSVNLVVEGGLVEAERVLVMDGDTVLDPGFVAAMRDGFYRLRSERRAGRTAYVLEDIALQSGAVTSARPAAGGLAAHWVWAARGAEYAFATLLRRGQAARVGLGRTFRGSRLYTVIGCGFTARRDAFPMPADTLTEDHDFTLRVQAGASTARRVDPATLQLLGFRVLLGGAPRALREVTGDRDVELRRTAHARFEPEAAMATEDPPRLGAYVGQVERWVGGGLENLAKRVLDPAGRRALTPNVRFALLASQLENVAGLLLLLALPAVLGLWWPWAGAAAVARAAAAWMAADLLATSSLVLLGGWLQARAGGRRPGPAGAWALRRAAIGVVPLVLLRPLNVVAYLAAFTRLLPRLFLQIAPEARQTTWERPRAITRGLPVRTAGVATAMVALATVGFVGSAHMASASLPFEPQVWRQLRAASAEDVARYALLPVVARAAYEPGRSGGGLGGRGDDAPDGTRAVSAFCPPGSVPRAAETRRLLDEDAGGYRPLSPWGVLTLARLAPLLALVEDAATSYDVPAALLLQVLLNESYLDPLAEGPTDDLGLSQVTADALALLRSISDGRGSGFANPRLFAGPFSLFDPDFSICAGAAKLAWVRHLPHGEDEEVAYARYVNPLHGAVEGRVSARHRPLVDAFVAVRPMVDGLAAAVGAYRRDPELVTAAERALLEVADAVGSGGLTVEGGYRASARQLASSGVDDRAFYRRVLAGLYGDAGERAASPDWVLGEGR